MGPGAFARSIRIERKVCLKRSFDKANIKLASFDVDWTIYADVIENGVFIRAYISEPVASAIVRLAGTGVTTVLATGRAHNGIPHSIMDLGVFRYAVCHGGSIVWDYEEDRPILRKPFARDLAKRIVQYLPSLTDSYHAALENNPRWGTYRRGSRSLKEINAELMDVLDEDSDAVFKIGCRLTPGEALEQAAIKLREEFGSEVELFIPEDNYIEICPLGVNKGAAFGALCDHLGIDPAQTIAFGDSANDVELLKLAGYSVVVESGQEEAKAIADYVAPSIWEDGVAMAIEDLFGV